MSTSTSAIGAPSFSLTVWTRRGCFSSTLLTFCLAVKNISLFVSDFPLFFSGRVKVTYPRDEELEWIHCWTLERAFFAPPAHKTERVKFSRDGTTGLSWKTLRKGFKGTVLQDRFRKCWRKLTDLVLNKGRGRFLIAQRHLWFFAEIKHNLSGQC